MGEFAIRDVVRDVPVDDFQAVGDIASIAITPVQTVVTTLQLVATATMDDGSTRVVTSLVTWASSDATKATISAGGLLTGVADGSTTVTATFGGKTGSQAYTVDVA
jgi:hypothetical protein